MNIVCSICIESIRVDEIVAPISCGHCFHSVCLNTWVQINKCCPHCRKPVTPSKIIRIYLDKTDPEDTDPIRLVQKVETLSAQIRAKQEEIWTWKMQMGKVAAEKEKRDIAVKCFIARIVKQHSITRQVWHERYEKVQKNLEEMVLNLTKEKCVLDMKVNKLMEKLQKVEFAKQQETQEKLKLALKLKALEASDVDLIESFPVEPETNWKVISQNPHEMNDSVNKIVIAKVGAEPKSGSSHKRHEGCELGVAKRPRIEVAESGRKRTKQEYIYDFDIDRLSATIKII